MKKLPIGIQNFREIIEDNYYYVDKTKYIYQLTANGKYYFLSRPRRFGKSLFVDTLKEAFSGNKELFKGLYLENHWDWSKKYPVINISFGSGVEDDKDLIDTIHSILNKHLEKNELKNKSDNFKIKFKDLIEDLHQKYNEKVVVLIDEYDKPILDKIENTKIAEQNREILRNFYSVIKDSDAYIKFAFITGVTKFNKVSIFSGLNQLKDITLSPTYSSICGYTEKEITNIFGERLADINMDEMRWWYNGYRWLGESVYNPFDVLLFLDEKIYQSYWFATGTPTFLMKLIKEKKYYLPQLETIELNDGTLDSFDIDNIEIENLLFQTGYLTIKSFKNDGFERYYEMSYPNYEVKVSLNRWILRYLSNIGASEETKLIKQIREAISKENVEKLRETLHSFFASIPHQWYVNNKINEYEGFYASMVYALFAATGLEVTCEDTTNKGRIDLTIKHGNKIY
ncbi:MAG: hypothetical protein D6799_07735, partial [Bacteroidetes bacterium]